MSCALSQKIDPEAPLFHRFLIAYGVTDEIFGVTAVSYTHLVHYILNVCRACCISAVFDCGNGTFGVSVVYCSGITGTSANQMCIRDRCNT